MEEITIGSGLSLSGGGVLTATGGSGSYDVFYVNLTQVSPNDYTGTASNFTAYSVNAVYFFVFDIVPSGVNAIRVNLNSTSYITIVKPAGGNLPATAITLTTAPYEFAYNGTNFVPESRVKIAGGGDALSSISAAIDTNTIDSTLYAQTWGWSTLTTQTAFTWTANAITTGSLFVLSSTSTVGDGSKLLQLTRSGANSTASKTNYGSYIAITNTGTTSTNVAGYFKASGASTNYGLQVAAGIAVINTTSAIYRTTNAGGNVTADFLVDGPGSVSSNSGSISFDDTNGLVFLNGNGTRRIARAAIAQTSSTHTAGSETGIMTFYTKPASGAMTERLKIDASGNILIDNPTDAYRLVINNSSSATVQFRIFNSTTGSSGSHGFDFGMTGLNAEITNLENGYLQFWTNATARFKIDNSGYAYFNQRLLVGSTATPSITFQVKAAGASSEFYNTTNSGTTTHYWSGNNSGGGVKYMEQRWIANDATNGAMYFVPNGGSSVLTLQSGGNIFIVNQCFVGGTTTPTAFIHIAAGTTAKAQIRFNDSTAPTAPNKGDMWFDGTNLKFYDGSATKTFTWT